MDRAYLSLDGGPRDPSTAIWIQSGSQYFDLRIPHDRPDLRDRRDLADLDADDLDALARQSGDTGVCTFDGDVATWHSQGDRFGFFSDEVAIFPEDGRIEKRGDVLFETQTERSPVPYEEAWVQQPGGCGVAAHLTLREAHGAREVLGALVVAGRYAGYVERCRWADGRSLRAHLAEATDLPGARALVAVEASYAIRAHPGAPFVVVHSSLPFREGRELAVPTLDAQRLEHSPQLVAQAPDAVWHVESWLVEPEDPAPP